MTTESLFGRLAERNKTSTMDKNKGIYMTCTMNSTYITMQLESQVFVSNVDKAIYKSFAHKNRLLPRLTTSVSSLQHSCVCQHSASNQKPENFVLEMNKA
ncbi:hypothetical protein HS088_TW21G01518 [Tripterygium wilfordii]|uniref:Uncharacterized protein n=1 Tax=Tripterygium wilfordii TaxID=458696 RepID=A0A7J7C5E4_TRIWF|nr:hypothetical protein HS088_TW21G01518 [Tripterygium wilfordii]